MRLLVALLLVLVALSVNAQDKPLYFPPEPDTSVIICGPPSMPHLIKGYAALDSFVKENFKFSHDTFGEFTIRVIFSLDSGGKMHNFELKEDKLGNGAGEEAIRVMKLASSFYIWDVSESDKKLLEHTKYMYPIILVFEEED